MKKQYVMGCDGGTGGMRVGIYTLSGEEIAFAATEYPTSHPHPGWAEQCPMDWWDALRQSIQKAFRKSGISKEEVLALSYDGTCGSILLSERDGTPIGNSMIWMDVRADEEAATISRTGHSALKFNGYGNVSAEWMPCKAMWLKKHRAQEYARADIVCEYADWITFRLIGRWTTSYSSISARWYYDSQNGGYPQDLFEQLGIGDVLAKLPQEIHHLGDRLGRISPDAASFLGLSEDTMIGQGGVDASVGLFGLGVIKPGRAALITGSSHLILGLTDTYSYRKGGVFGPFPDAIMPGYGLVEGGQISSGSIVNWFKTNFCQDLKGHPDGIYEILNGEASQIPIGSDGLLVLDWWQGNRTPYTDQTIRGNIYGLSLHHTRAHLYRAILEGVAFGTENVIQSFRENGFPIQDVYISGGTTNSPLWMQIHADVSNVNIHVPKNPQAPTLGGAILAAVSAGVYTIPEAVSHMVQYNDVIHPDPDRHKKYQKLFRQYRMAYEAFGQWMRDTSVVFQDLDAIPTNFQEV